MSASDSASDIINNIITYSQQHGDLLNKFSLDFFLNYFDRNAILSIATYILPHKPLTPEEFIRIFLLTITHSPEQTLYLTLSLHKLFHSILERTSSSCNTIEFSDFTTYLCQKISKDDLDIVIAPKKIRQDSVATSLNIRDIDLHPPTVISKIAQEIPKVSKDLPKKNKKLDEKRGVSKIFCSKDYQKIIAVGTLSSSIYIYDSNLKEQRQVKAKECKEMDKQIAILSMAYSSRSHRIGAILTSGMMVFWEGCDDFSIEKIIPIKNYGQKIFYLQLFNEWITVDRNTLNFWNLKQQCVTQSISCKEAVTIMDICEINHLKAICISVVTTKEEKLLVVYHQGKRMAQINLGSSACHTLHYNKLTQSLIPLGYTSLVQVYTIQGMGFDVELKYILRGHKSIITCVDSLQHNTLMVTGDDTGQIRIWELTYMRCVQSIKLTKWLGGLRFMGSKLLYSDSRINTLQLQHFQPREAQKEVALYQYYDQNQQCLWIFTKKDVRKTDIKQGKILNIFVLCNEEVDISAAVHIGDGFIVGNSKGDIYHYDSDCNIRWHIPAHQGQVKDLLYDSKNRLIFSLGAEGRIVGWSQRNSQLQKERKVILFKRKQISYLRVSSKSNILIAGNTQEKELTIWDYEVLDLLEVLQMKSVITAVEISELIDLIMVATIDMTITFLKFTKKQHKLDLKIICLIDLTLNQSSQHSLVTQHQYVNSLLLVPLQNSTLFNALISTNKGLIFNFDLTTVINHHYTITHSSSIKDSVNILRSQKQEFQICFSQRGHKQQIGNISNQSQEEQNKSKVAWVKKICKDGLLGLSRLGVKENLIGALCQDYSKIIDITTSQIEASLNINQPLPIKWTNLLDDHAELKKNVYSSLKILDNILKSKGYEMLAKEYKMINITPFMDMMKASHSTPASSVLPPIVCDNKLVSESSYTEPTLKSLQAYKRVKQIKKISEESMQMPPILSKSNKEGLMDRDNIIHMLANESYTEFVDKYHIDKDPYLSSLSAKLHQSLLHQQSKKPRTLKYPESRQMKRRGFYDRASAKDATMKEITNLSKSINLKSSRELWQEKSEQKSIHEILGKLNSKLKKCRINYNREIDQQRTISYT